MAKRTKTVFILSVLVLLVMLLLALLYVYCLYKYPLRYEALIAKYAEEFSLDPYLVATVIWAESHYNETIVSSSGAVGLMQIMPETGEWIAEKLGVQDFKSDMLFSADTNIRFGCWYLSYLESKFDGDMIKILAGYNAGPNKVQQWQEEWGEEYSPLWEDIPYEETKNYVKKIQNTQKIYQLLYNLD